MYLESIEYEEQIKKFLTQILKNYVVEWLGSTKFRNKFNFKDAIDTCGEHKLDLIIYHVESLMEENSELKPVYEKIIEFRNLRDFLNYLSPHSYDTAESTFLDILRNHKKIRIVEHDKDDTFTFYYSSELDQYIKESEKISKLSIYFRSFIEILLDVKKEAFSFDELYDFLLNEEMSYDLAKNYNAFHYFRKGKGYSIPEILKLIEGEEVLTPKMIFINQIKKDHNRFYKIIDNYYGLKKWNLETEFQVYLKLFDKFLQNNKEDYKYLGQEVLDFIPKVDNTKFQTNRLEKNIKRILERG